MRFDPGDPDFRRDPYPTYALLRQHAPFYYWPTAHMWFVSTYADCAALMREPSLGRSEMQIALVPADQVPIRDMLSRWFLLMDPPDHTRLRGLVHKAFSPRMVEQLRESVNLLANELLDKVEDKVEAQGQMDLIADYAYPLPVRVICTLLGVPAEDHATFGEWTYAFARALDLTDDRSVFVAAAAAATALTEYMGGLLDERRTRPQNDLFSALVAVEEAGDRLSREELFATCGLLLMAGHETTAHLIGNGTLALLRQPRQWERLVANPDLAYSAVEETLRFDGPIQRNTRLIHEEFTYRDVTFEVGQQISFLTGSANRDGEQFPNPDQFDIARQNIKHFAFGSGIHYCIGAPLARLEGAIAFRTLSRRFPTLTLQDAPLVYRSNITLRALEALWVKF